MGIKLKEVELEELEKKSAREVVKWALETFGERIALASSFGAEDVVLVDMMVKISPKARIFTLDTGRLPQETYDVMERIREKYKINIETYFPEAKEVEEMETQYGPNLFYNSVELRKLCCNVRKVKPLNRALSNLSAWICGLRREQAVTRGEVKKVEIDSSHNSIYKINPLADWSEKEVWDYIKKNNVPYNALHDKDYPSIGCAPCSRAVKSGEDIRAGRWWWENPETKECGLHCKK
jgi:phosphoadenosine phosphosulfate reductase